MPCSQTSASDRGLPRPGDQEAAGGRARVLASFAAFGAFWGAWGAVLPAVQQRSGADDAQLGSALLLVGLGALLSMRVTGLLFDRLGPRVTPFAVGTFGAFGVLPALARSPLELAVALFVLGAASGAMDVAINTEGVREEGASGRPLLNLAHATFSAGVVAASLTTGGLRAAGGGPLLVLGLVATAVILTAVLVRTKGARAAAVPPGHAGATGGAGRPGLFQRVPAWVLLLGALCALAYWVENAWQSWSAVHLERTLAAVPAVSALGPAAFAAAAMAGRLAGHGLARRMSDRGLLVAGALVAAGGSALAATASSVPLAVAGIVVAGVGSSVLAPTIIGLAGAAAPPGERGTVVSSVTTLAYLGFLVGPAAVGALAGITTLRTSLTAVAGLAFVLALLLAAVRLPRRASSDAAVRPRLSHGR